MKAKIEIEIDCDGVEEVFSHLAVATRELKRKVQKRSKGPFSVTDVAYTTTDNNCYGTHIAKLKIDED